ncbi:hypothetical protein MUK42_28211 [Musa troglodytarum]|uniref:Protein kinase domain-containing protein n=1 Tax=Musa troglodytarum TaxID=320322 RepID=A0A9E7JQ94_9LILI|nr:hypothetical protein MUK42_28211 [Musa troglodytarum]
MFSRMPITVGLGLIADGIAILAYKLIKEVGDGTFGTVWRAINKQSGEVVAIKKMKRKYYSWEECVNLREVKSLRRMNHPNIVKLKEVIRENDMLYLVFEYMECNLYQIMKDKSKGFSESEIRNWYRAPEVLLQSSIYDAAVDMWAMGAIMAELFTLCPLFPGSSEADEIYKICSVIGNPNENSWAEGLQLADVLKYQFPQCSAVQLEVLIPSASKEAVNLIKALCSWDPCRRPKATEALQHPFFQTCLRIHPSFHSRLAGLSHTPPVGNKGALAQNGTRRYSTGPLSVTRSANNFISAKANGSLRAGVQRKLEMNEKEVEKNGRSLGNNLRQSRYKPPARNNTGYLALKSQKIVDVPSKMPCTKIADKLSHMSLDSGIQKAGKPPPPHETPGRRIVTTRVEIALMSWMILGKNVRVVAGD